MKKRVNTYLAIAITTMCNYRCFYCKRGGESISKTEETIPFETIKRVITLAYENGIRNFRITGGEPTGVSYFGELIEHIMNLSGTKVRINTNGFRILEYMEVLKKYRARLDVVFSVDSISQYIGGIHFPKFLSENVMKITKILRESEIPVRYNIVVTSINKSEVKKLVLKAVDELHVNVKLLDLNKFSEYLGYKNLVSGKKAICLWEELFVPMSDFYEFLKEISDKSASEWTTGMVGKAQGIPMSAYFRGDNWIQVKDSSRGAKYSSFCRANCDYYRLGNCQEGVFSLFLSSDLTLHLSGCKNEDIHFKLDNSDEDYIKTAFSELLELV